jgi:ribonuclease P protein component
LKKFVLSHQERIKSKKQFDQLYSTGTKIISKNKKLKAIYKIEDSSEQCVVKIAVAIHKKSGSAVWRNRFKRLIKESYRLNKQLIISEAISRQKTVYVAFASNSINQKSFKDITLSDIVDEVIDLIEKIKNSF